MSKFEIDDKLKNLNGSLLDREPDAIAQALHSQHFRDAITFVLRVAFESEEMDHHPDILIEYNRVRFTLRTHSEGGVTEKDFELAYRIDKI
ncbi:4a-hydroxytetrahydrobiopterin dehydratase [Candidatus Kryptonium thompsonii]|uniref:4a-hydroxytetrahydrobiopterin dehydratase n=1 Tax=Candidatus Kryptonium thompsonii TaxID=1633631 RepID=UPI0013520732|nr:4a-hydroxytetrahydrobiopterin dehydratase [Candidatus Kryptonium thompsoni]